MDAHFFRFLARDLASRLTGGRIEKIFAPAHDVWSFLISSGRGKEYLLFRPAKSAGLLFLSRTKPANPMQPPAQCMWFRKRVQGRRIPEISADWPRLLLAFTLTPRRDPTISDPGTHLLLNLRTGPELLTEPPEFCGEPEWPSPEDIAADPEIWRHRPHISPPLRRLARENPDDFPALYSALRHGNPPGFFVPERDDLPLPPLAWPPPGPGKGDISIRFNSPLEAATHHGERTLFPLLDRTASSEETTARKRAIKRVKRNLAVLDREEDRLRELMNSKTAAELLQTHLYRIKEQEGLEHFTGDHPEHGPMNVDLNPHLTPAENMARLFKLAAKGERGMVHCARRRRELENELERLKSGGLPESARPAPDRTQSAGNTKTPSLPKKFRALAVSAFISPDGFLVIRGKNKKANHELSKNASPFDLWFHAKDVPGAHVILKRDHPAQDVPRESMEFAARKAAEKSGCAGAAKADVLCAAAKDVRTVKGADLGRVNVDKVLEVVRVGLKENE